MRNGRTLKNPERTARLLQQGANGLCYARMIAGPLLGLYIARQPESGYRSWKMATLVGVLSATDALDGKLARRAARLDPNVNDQGGAWRDQMADKIFTHAILGGMVVSAARNNQPELATGLLVNQAVQLTRDALITGVRKRASEHGVATNAQLLGKIKTGALLASTITMASPLATNHEGTASVGQIASSIGFTIGSGLAVVSGISLAHNLEAQMPTPEPNQPAILYLDASATIPTADETSPIA